MFRVRLRISLKIGASVPGMVLDAKLGLCLAVIWQEPSLQNYW